MKMKCHVIAVEDNGDRLKVRMQGEGTADAAWRPMNVVEFTCADTDAHRRALYIGRNVMVEVKPL